MTEYYLRLDQHQIDKKYDIVMLDVFVGEPLAARTLRQADPFAKGEVISLAIGGVEMGDGVGAFDADGHGVMSCHVMTDAIVVGWSWS
jgi:hypothetical protein